LASLALRMRMVLLMPFTNPLILRSARGEAGGASRRTHGVNATLLRGLVERLDPEIVDRDPPVDAVLLGRIVAGGAVIGTAIVPDHDVALFPFVMVLGVGCDHPLLRSEEHT